MLTVYSEYYDSIFKKLLTILKIIIVHVSKLLTITIFKLLLCFVLFVISTYWMNRESRYCTTTTMDKELVTNEQQESFTSVRNDDGIGTDESTVSEAGMEEDSASNECNEEIDCAISPLSSHNKEVEKHEDEAFKSKPIAKVFKSFDQRLVELKAFKSQYGHCRVPSKFESNPSLAAWCANLKQSHRLMQEGRKPILKLTEEKVDSLEQLGFEWKYSGRTPKVSKTKASIVLQSSPGHVEKQTKFKMEHPANHVHAENQQSFASSSEDSSGDVLPSSRTSDKKKSSTTRSCISFAGDDESKKSSKRKIEEVVTEEMQEGNDVVKKKTPRRERGKSKNFQERLQELKVYKDKFGHCRVSRNDKNHYSLGSWCHNIRGSYRANQKLDSGVDPILSQDKISALNEIGFDWTLKEPRQLKSFEERIEDLKEFKDLFGHTRVPSGYEKNPSLAYWCNNLRNAFKMKKTGKKQYISLTEDRIDALVAIGFEFGKKYSKPPGRIDVDGKASKGTSNEDCKEEEVKENIKSPRTRDIIAPSKENHMRVLNNGQDDGDDELIKLEGGIGPILFV